MSSSVSFNPNTHSIHHTSNIILTNGSTSAAAATASLPGSKSAQQQLNPKANKLIADYKQIILELRAQNFDVIRFATYRTASKLRFIQKKLNLHLIDLWNVIETFRDNNLHTLDLLNEIDSIKLESCIQNMYIELNKRLAYNQHINVENQTQLLLAWLLNIFDKQRLSRIKVISFKVALTTMCAGKLTDKIKYMFNQISDLSKNCLAVPKFELYLKELLQLPTSVFEEPSFGYNESLSKTCFDLSVPIRLNDFLNVVLSDAGPACFIWLNVFHRFTVVQSVTHPVTCSVCQRTNFNGFRYKCQKCRKYQLCQDCFWRGRVSHSHQLTHQMKEYTSYKSAAKQFSNSLKKSFFCKPNKQAQQRQQQLEQYSQQLNYSKQLSYVNDKQRQLSRSTNIDNSDYGMLIRQQQQLQSDPTDIYNATNNPHSPVKFRNLQQQQKIGAIDDYSSENDQIKTTIQKPIDLPHIIPPLQENILQPTHSSNHLQSTLKKSSTQQQPTYSNTLSMTRNSKQPNDNNLLANFLLTKSSNSSTNLIAQDEHSIIANYSSLLCEYYQKNPHLSSSPTTATNPSPPPPLQQQQQQQPTSSSQLKSSVSSKLQNRQSISNDYSLKAAKTKSFLINDSPSVYYNMFDSPVNNTTTNAKANKTASLSRHLLPSTVATYSSSSPSHNQTNNSEYQKSNLNSKLNTYYNTNSSYSTTTTNNNNNNKMLTLPTSSSNATRSLSESNFRLNNNILHTQITSNEEYPQQAQPQAQPLNEDKLLKEKREIVAKLEQQNREIIKEIKRLKMQQLSNRSLDLNEHQKKLMLKSLKENTSSVNAAKKGDESASAFTSSSTMINPYIIAELQTLKQRKGQLENRMHLLESSRDELIGQLTQLDNVLKQNKQTTSKTQQRNGVPITSTTSLRSPTHSPLTIPKQKYATLTQQSSSQSKHAQLNNIDSSMQAISLNNIVPSTTQTFVPIVSASVAMQMPMPVQQNQQQQQQQQQHQQRSNIITNTSARRSNAQPRSWSTPNTPAMYEMHTSRVSHHNGNQLQSVPNQQVGLSKVASSLPHSSSSLLSLAALSNTNSCSLSSNTSGLLNPNQTNMTNSSTSNLRNLRNDLLIAADSVTNAMQSLVKELHSENEMSFNTSSDDEQDEENSNNDLDATGKQMVLDQLAKLTSQQAYRRPIDNNELLKQQLLMLNNAPRINLESNELNEYLNENTNNNTTNVNNEDDEENLLTESFIDDLNNNTTNAVVDTNLINEIASNNAKLQLQQQQLQMQLQQHQLQSQLIANLASNNSEQVASWRRELEQRLIDDNDTANLNDNHLDEQQSDEQQLFELEENINNNKSKQ